MDVFVRRDWKSSREGSVSLDKVGGLHWSRISGGVQSFAPQYFIHGYVSCDMIDGEISHSCMHGTGPHSIKVVLVKKSQSKKVWEELMNVVGPKPKA